MTQPFLASMENDMKKTFLLIILAGFGGQALAENYVNGYYRNDGTYVQPHYRTEPNSVKYDNYSSQGNTNPHNGNQGYQRNEFSSPPSYNQRNSGYNKRKSSYDQR
jgi:hypothetical protein